MRVCRKSPSGGCDCSLRILPYEKHSVHRGLEERDEIAERFAGEGIDVSHERLEVDEVVVGLHPGLCHLLAQTIERGKIGALRDLLRQQDVEHAHMITDCSWASKCGK